MKKKFPAPQKALLLLFMFLLLLFVPLSTGSATGAGEAVGLQIEGYLATGFGFAGADLNMEKLPAFYSKRSFRPVWSDGEGLLPEAEQLIETLKAAESQGLEPDRYHLQRILALGKYPHAELLAELDLLLTDAFLAYCIDLRSGRADPRDADPEWFVRVDLIDHLALLERALETGTLAEVLARLSPRHPWYERLRQGLLRYRRIQARGGWRPLVSSKLLRRGMGGPEVALLRERLRIGGDIVGEGGIFDRQLEEAVRGFQARHGLEADGIVGPRTRASLDVPVEERIGQILINLERWRWMPRSFGRSYLVVNMAGFELRVFETHRTVLKMRVIVGRAYRRTPAFSKPISYLVFNPRWNVPRSIAVKDILPKARTDPDFLVRQGIRVFGGWGEGARELDPLQIDWSKVDPGLFPYRFRQDPGAKNALGRVKFMLPNRFDVYLHDTPHRHLFEKRVRTFSSGCIRLERPLELAEYLLRGGPDWDRQRIRGAVESGRRQIVTLPKPFPVFLVYWTAWVDEEGSLHFRDDVYGRDRLLRQALNRTGRSGGE